jgi:hypothetical protein
MPADHISPAPSYRTQIRLNTMSFQLLVIRQNTMSLKIYVSYLLKPITYLLL